MAAHCPPPPPVSNLDRRNTGRLRKRGNLLTGEGVGGGRGAKSYDSKKSWSSINRSILSGVGASLKHGMKFVTGKYVNDQLNFLMHQNNVQYFNKYMEKSIYFLFFKFFGLNNSKIIQSWVLNRRDIKELPKNGSCLVW